MDEAFLILRIKNGELNSSTIASSDHRLLTRTCGGCLLATAASAPGKTYGDAIERLCQYLVSREAEMCGLNQAIDVMDVLSREYIERARAAKGQSDTRHHSDQQQGIPGALRKNV